MHREGTLTAPDGLVLAWQAWLPSGKPRGSLALVHGGAEHSGRYSHLVSQLVESGYEVYAPDLRGHGRSGGRRGTVEYFTDYLDDLDAFLRLMADAGAASPTFLLGYSLGALICATYALDHQDELAGVILAGPALGAGESILLQFRIARVLAAVAPKLPLFTMDPKTMMQDPAVLGAYRTDPLVFHGRFDARLLRECVGAMRRYPDRIGGLRLPLLILHGGSDVTADVSGSRMTIERVGSTDKTLRIYDGMRHDIFNEPAHDQVCADVSSWLDAHSASAELSTS